MESITDEKILIQQAFVGDKAAFTDLVEAYQRPVYNLCYRMLGEVEAAEEAAQETFLRAYQNLNRYDCARPFATWLLSIAAHHCIDRLRREHFHCLSIEKHRDQGIDLPDCRVPDPERESERRLDAELLHSLLHSLRPGYRAVLVLRYWQEASTEEIARILHLSIPTVKSRLHRARLELAARWEQQAKKQETRFEEIVYAR